MSRGMSLLVVVAMGVFLGLTGVVPVTSQTLRMEALQVEDPIPSDEPWAAIWDSVPAEQVPLSAQSIVPPFGGGTVDSIAARAAHDGRRLYFLIEWADRVPDDAVNGAQEFSDAAALQFPSISGTSPPYMMGGPSAQVNIWQWKAVWQADIGNGFATTQTRYPDTYVDFYPQAEDDLYKPALRVGNPLSQRQHDSPIENLVAEGFGTLTSSDIQDIEGAGEWRDGRWRALFVRDLEPSAPGLAQFSVGESTLVAFAVWDGSGNDRNGQKSVAQFIELQLSTETATITEPSKGGIGGGLWTFLLVMALLAAVMVRLVTWGRPPSNEHKGIRIEIIPPGDGSD